MFGKSYSHIIYTAMPSVALVLTLSGCSMSDNSGIHSAVAKYVSNSGGVCVDTDIFQAVQIHQSPPIKLGPLDFYYAKGVGNALDDRDRKVRLDQLDLLAQAGFFRKVVKTFTLRHYPAFSFIGSKPVAFKRTYYIYFVTKYGEQHIKSEFAGFNVCFGHPYLVKMVSYTHPHYNQLLSAKSTVVNYLAALTAPEWAKNPVYQKAFHYNLSTIYNGHGSVTLVKTNKGWAPVGGM